jgi:hypothetical protein
MTRVAPLEYDFIPTSWILPNDMLKFQLHLKSKKDAFYIAKPDRGCQGKGIFLFKNMEDFEILKNAQEKRFLEFYDKCDLVIQQYVPNPFLLDGYKFDLRIYVLIKSMDPLEIFIHREGLVRLATAKYQKPNKVNITNTRMHLTNYAVNKDSKNFIQDDSGEKGTKRSLTSLWDQLDQMGYDSHAIWGNIEDVIVKTLLIARPDIKNVTSHKKLHTDESVHFRRCFEVLGFDVMLDSNLRPIVLEVNHSPSFTCDSKLDWNIKSQVITDSLKVMSTEFEDILETTRSSKKALNKIPSSSWLLFPPKEKLEGWGLYSRAYPNQDPVKQSYYDACQDKVLETIRENKTVNERNKYIQKKIKEVYSVEEKYHEWREKHREKNKKYQHKGDRIVPVKEVVVRKRKEKVMLEKIPLKMSVTELFLPVI